MCTTVTPLKLITEEGAKQGQRTMEGKVGRQRGAGGKDRRKERSEEREPSLVIADGRKRMRNWRTRNSK